VGSLFSSCADITARKHAEDELRAKVPSPWSARERWFFLFDEQNILDVNRQPRGSGYTREELIKARVDSIRIST
jgi:hypothetical protein